MSSIPSNTSAQSTSTTTATAVATTILSEATKKKVKKITILPINLQESSTPLTIECEMNMRSIYEKVKCECAGILGKKKFLLKEKDKFIFPYDKNIKVQSLTMIIQNFDSSNNSNNNNEEKSKMAGKWKKRKMYKEIFSEMHDFVRPDYWMGFVNDEDMLKSIIESLESNDCRGICKFFEIDQFMKSSTKENVRKLLNDFLSPILIVGAVSENESKMLLEFKPPLFLNPSSKECYIGNLYEKSNLKRLMGSSHLSTILCLLEQCGNTQDVPEEIKALLTFSEIDKTSEYITNLKLVPIDEEKRKAILNALKNKEGNVIQQMAKGVKFILKRDGKRDEFNPEIRKKAWDKCKKLKISKIITEINNYFRLDMYGGVISMIGISGGPTGVQLDHIFPDNLGGPNTLENAANIHWRANNLKSDTPKEFLEICPDGKDWFNEDQFLQCVKLYGIWSVLGKTPFGIDNELDKSNLMELEQKLKAWEPTKKA